MREAERLNATGEPVNLATYRLAEFIKDYVERAIKWAIDSQSRNAGTIGASLIMEICNGYGIDPFYDMAKDFMQTATESVA